MRRIMALAILVGCSSDYDIGQDVEAFGANNPQGIEAPINSDRIVQTTAAEVDVLFVIDNSGSMSDNQTKLGQNFPEFMKEFEGSGLDYHIGVITTDVYTDGHNGKLRPTQGKLWIDDTFGDPVSAFSELAMVGDEGSGDERGREACYRALVDEAQAHNIGFIRDDAGLLQSDKVREALQWRRYDSVRLAKDALEALQGTARSAAGATFRALLFFARLLEGRGLYKTVALDPLVLEDTLACVIIQNGPIFTT